MPDRDWFTDEHFWRDLYPFMFRESRLDEPAEQIDNLLQLVDPCGHDVLDLCCGPGRWSVALAARGYWQAFQLVKESVKKVLEGASPGDVADNDLGGWYRELFAPSVTAGLVSPANLAGYRNGPVYIRRSKHVPLNPDAVRDAMPAFFDLLREEEDAAARIVLGHFIFVYIHPYFDGNGRTARFLMNVMMAAAGRPWTIIKLDHRDAYMAALEQASVEENITPFAKLLAGIATE